MDLLSQDRLPQEAIEPLCELLQIATERLGVDLRSMYGMGSLGYGGFVPGWSDFDIDILVHGTLYQEAGAYMELALEMQQVVHEMGHTRVDVKCYTVEDMNNRTLPFSHGISNRTVMLLKSATLLYGEDVRPFLKEPTPEQLQKESITLVEWMLSRDDEWWGSLPIDDTAAFLAQPARLLYTRETGKVTNKKQALEFFFSHYQEKIPADLWIWAIWAMSCRTLPQAQQIPEVVLVSARQAARDLMKWTLQELSAEYTLL